MANCDNLLTLIAKLSSVEREYLDLKLTPKYRNHLLSPCSLSTQQFAELICVLRPLLPELEPALIAIASALPPTQDFGITTQGPAETPYTVPADTVTYENIADTPCGGLIRKVITTTYAGRSVADQLRLISQWGGSGGNATDPAFTESFTSYGATTTQVFDAEVQRALPLVPAIISVPGIGLYNLFDPLAGSSGSGVITYTNGTIRYSVLDLARPGYSLTVLTLYYLDTHIIWTYEIV